MNERIEAISRRPPEGPDRDRDLRASTQLLGLELPDRRFVDSSYLRWLYDANPTGESFEASVDDGPDRLGHYALISQEYRNAHRRARFVFSLNAVTRSSGQRRGLFQQLGADVYGQARAAGVECVIGVSNRNSTPPVVRRMGWRLLGPLPVRVALARRPAPGWWSAPAEDAVIDERWKESIGAIDEHDAYEWTNVWTGQSLAWRLGSPNTLPYAVHVGPDLVCVSTIDHAGPVPIAVILKLLPRGRGGAVRGGPAVAAVCRFHRTPAAIYAGWNRHVSLPGVPVPTRLRPAPLNLIVKSLSPDIDQDRFALDSFEFLDMDAY